MMKPCLAVALVAGTVLVSSANAQKSLGPALPLLPFQRTVQVYPFAPTLEVPISVARAVLVNGKTQIVGPWIPYTGSGGDVPTVPVYDCFEPDATGFPGGFCTSGCNQANNCPAAPAGSRWWYGATNLNPFSTNDMTIAPGFNNAHCTGVEFEWYWGGTTTRGCYIAVFTAETFNDCPSGQTGSSGGFPGVVFNFGPITGGGAHYTNADLTAGGLFFTMPADGSGAYIMQTLTDDPANPGQQILDVTPGNQPMLWGTGDGETPPDGRVGHNGNTEWWDSNGDGAYTAPGECINLLLGAGYCPVPFGDMVIFLTEQSTATGACCTSAGCQILTSGDCAAAGGTYGGDNTTCSGAGEPSTCCYPNCDGSTLGPCLNVQDFGCFLNAFAAGNTYANCDASTTEPILNVQDFGCFLNEFAAGCSNC